MDSTIVRKYQQVEKSIAAHPQHLLFGSGVPEEAIQKAEADLQVTFPLSFRHFLARYDSAFIGGDEVYGLCDLEPEEDEIVLDVVRYTRNAREDGDIGPACVLLVNEDGDRLYYLDTAVRDDRGESPVLLKDISEPDPVLYAEDFVSFLIKRMDFFGWLAEP